MRHLWILTCTLAVAACLPNTLTDAQLTAKIADATQGKGGPLCGNNVIDPPSETCDDGNTDACDDCDKCQKRTALDVKDLSSLAGVTTLGALQFDSKQNWSIETWFFMRTAPKSLPAPFLVVAVLNDKAPDTSVVFAMGVKPQGGGGVPYCSLQRSTKSESTGPNLAPNTWHHLRCVWNAKDGDMRASVDGGALATASGKLAQKPAPGFENNAWMLLGRLPVSGAVSVPGAEAFDGLLDEVRAAQGPNVATTALSRRYGTENAETVALYHMDPEQPLRFLPDATANQLDAAQITLQGATPMERDAVLSFAAEGCYGFSAVSAQCQAGPTPPWCP